MKKTFIHCEKCGKRLIERTPNGLFHFMFGRRTNSNGDDLNDSPVDILIHGSIIIKCLSGKCRHLNKLTFLPNPQDSVEEIPQSASTEPSSD